VRKTLEDWGRIEEEGVAEQELQLGVQTSKFYPPSQNAPSGRTGTNAKRVSAEALASQRTCLPARSISMKAGSASRSAKEDMLRRVSPKL